MKILGFIILGMALAYLLLFLGETGLVLGGAIFEYTIREIALTGER